LRYSPATQIIGNDVVRVTRSTLDDVNALIRRRGESGIEIEGNPDDVCESYPPSSAWGRSGWSYTTIEAATKKFEELKNNDQYGLKQDYWRR
jgi:hypothetical protein